MKTDKREAYIRHCIENLFVASELTTSIGTIGMWLNRTSHDLMEELTYEMGCSFAETESEVISLFGEYFQVYGKKVYCVVIPVTSHKDAVNVINRKMYIEHLLESEEL